ATNFTLEAWVNWTGGGVGTSTGGGGIANAIPVITKGRAELETPANLNMNYFLGIDATSGKLVGDFEDTAGGGNHPVTGTTPLTTNTWHHAAATYDGTTWRLYLDGVLDKTLVVGNFTPEATSIQHAALGTALTSTGAAAGFLAGALDEARIWSVARTGSQIRSTKDDEISGPQTGLLGRWGLNDGSGTIAANSAGAINGTLVGSPTWIAGFGFPQDTTAPASPTNLVATAADGGARLTWTANSEPDLAGYNLYRSTTSPVDLTAAPINGSDLLRTTAYTDSGLVNGTTYHYALVAVDGADNRSTAVETSVVPATNGIPTVTPGGPSNGATGTSTSPTLSVTATDPEGATLTVAFYGRTAASGIFTLITTNTGVASGAGTTTTWSGRDDGQRYEWYVTASDGATTVTSSIWTFDTVPGSDPVLVGAGDIASCASSGGEATASILEGVSGRVFTLGDNAYESGLLTEFTSCYEPTWGRPATKSRTRPTSGNHDFGNGTNNGDGYFGYFNGVGVADGPAGPRPTGIYSYDIGPNWHVIVLNSECGQVDVGCGIGSPQETWLRAELTAPANRGKNVIAMIHRPRFGSGFSGGDTELAPLWQDFYDYGVDLVLSGHEHDYERFAPMDGNGNADPVNGVREIIVGTGGVSHAGVTTVKPNSVVRNFDTFGVLRLTLHASSYDWEFLPVGGATFTDSGTGVTIGGSNSAPVIDSVSIAPTSPTT
ncbi:MAG TPA: LamG-like jellyroll fold domain-containing protein, partial [Pengzhenrongella sp.]